MLVLRRSAGGSIFIGPKKQMSLTVVSVDGTDIQLSIQLQPGGALYRKVVYDRLFFPWHVRAVEQKRPMLRVQDPAVKMTNDGLCTMNLGVGDEFYIGHVVYVAVLDTQLETVGIGFRSHTDIPIMRDDSLGMEPRQPVYLPEQRKVQRFRVATSM